MQPLNITELSNLSKTIPLAKQENIINDWIIAADRKSLTQDLLSSPEIIKKSQEYYLTLPEQMAIRHYTDNGYAALNAVLNKSHSFGNQTDTIERKGGDLLRQALDKLPNYNDVVVFSRQDLPVTFLDKILKLDDVRFLAFLSANVGYDLRSFRKHRLIIESRTGKHIAWISANSDTEDEVLFKDSTWFTVDSIEYMPNAEIWFYLSEMDYD